MPTFRKPVVGNDLLPSQGRPVREERPTRRPNYAFIILTLFTLCALSAAGYFYYKYRNVSSQNMTQTEVAALVEKVGKHMILPEGEVPTVATVVDPSVLKDQPFFLNAKEGDKVLVYPNHKRAVLYRPESDKIIEVMPFEIPAQPAK